MKITCKTFGFYLLSFMLMLGLSGCSQMGVGDFKLPRFQKQQPQQQSRQPVVSQPTVQSVVRQQPAPQIVQPLPQQQQAQNFNPIQVSPQQQLAPLGAPLYSTPYYSPTDGQRIGQAGQKTRVALLLPTGASGRLGDVARQMRNAALLARDDAGSLIDLNFYDTQGNGTASASEAVGRALNEGAELILGPLQGGNVAQIAAQANGRGVNLLSFSNDLSQARPGAYLLGVAPDAAVQRVVSFAAQRGMRNIAVLMPRSSYGSRALAAAEDIALQSGIRLIGPFTYDATSGSDDRKSAVKSLAEQSDGFEAILIADNAQSSREIAALLVFNQVDIATKKVLGTNLWTDTVVQQEAGLRGAWFAAAPENEWQNFQSRYATRFGQSPEKVAGIAYDAATLASTLVRQGRGFDANTLSTTSGFNGLFGAYRLSPTGRTIRSMDILEIRAGGTTVLQPAAGFTGFGS